MPLEENEGTFFKSERPLALKNFRKMRGFGDKRILYLHVMEPYFVCTQLRRIGSFNITENIFSKHVTLLRQICRVEIKQAGKTWLLYTIFCHAKAISLFSFSLEAWLLEKQQKWETGHCSREELEIWKYMQKGESAGREDIYIFNHLGTSQVFLFKYLAKAISSIINDFGAPLAQKEQKGNIVMENWKGLPLLWGCDSLSYAIVAFAL